MTDSPALPAARARPCFRPSPPLRDRAILSVGLQVGFRRAEIAALKVGDLHQNQGFDALHVIRKGGRREALAISPQAAHRIRAYLERAGHGDQPDTPLFRPLRDNGRPLDPARRMDSGPIDRVVRKYAAKIGLYRGYSAHSIRAKFITTARRDTATRPRRSVTAGAGIVRRRRPAFLRRIEAARWIKTAQPNGRESAR